MARNILAQPFVVDQSSLERYTGVQIDWDNVPVAYTDGYSSTDYAVVVDDAAASQSDVALGVEALEVAIPAGTYLDFGEHASGWQMVAKVTTLAAAAATSLVVEPLSGAIEDDAEATYNVVAYTADSTRLKVIVAGTIVKRNASQSWVPNASNTALVDGTDDDGILISDAYEDDPTTAGENYGIYIGGVLYENLLPDYIAGNTTITGSLHGFRGFQTFTYSDSRA